MSSAGDIVSFTAQVASCVIAIAAIIVVATTSTTCPDTTAFLTYVNGIAVINPAATVCVGSRAQCTATRLATGYLHTFVPIITGSHIIRPFPSMLGIYYTNASSNPDDISKPIAFFGNGGAVIGSSPYYLQKNLITIVGTPASPPVQIIADAWVVSSAINFVDPITNSTHILSSVCHVANTSMCGVLLQASPSDDGVFHSDERTIIKRVPYGFIQANTLSHVLVTNMTVASYTNAGSAIPCVPTPPYTEHYSTNVYLQVYPTQGDSCVDFTGNPLKQVVQLDTCLPTTSQSALYALSVFTYPDSLAASATVSYDGLAAYVSFFADSVCTTMISAQPSVYPAGCVPNQPYFWYRVRK
jgi:hypothetical protein